MVLKRPRSPTSCSGIEDVLKPFSGDTDIFIFPGRPFHVVDALVTNFHQPGSVRC